MTSLAMVIVSNFRDLGCERHLVNFHPSQTGKTLWYNPALRLCISLRVSLEIRQRPLVVSSGEQGGLAEPPEESRN